MKDSIYPDFCFWCDNGRVSKGKCQDCGATYGHKKEQHKKLRMTLPKIKEVLPQCLAKEFRPRKHEAA